ncbi:glycoside hydrolase family 3 protein [Brucepastera parasyntrophica]|uniref:glycoside hydrolase family 3 N-terminal domain-containing protein n=1 Tax=Brucepastera parasyntrophica TaxID=2880008 RepID=UPI00210A69AE|nr:glycoside hydrolase family 3 N-terminal domain-containing protein [Brucepastera parasyntrophica]ULQ60190.1 glycoside hydrolase family 3 protein [Brucepastera parasyntrophica]
MAIPHDEWQRKQIESLVSSMSLQEKSSQVLITCIDGNDRFHPYLYRHFRDVIPGAVLLFGYNIAGGPEAVFDYIASCNAAFQSLGARVPVLFGIDNEGGDVFRLGSIGTRLPSAKTVAENFSPAEACELYRQSAVQLAELGITLSFSPVAEILTDENRAFLGTRSFSSSLDTVVRYSEAAISAGSSAGIINAVKHFPGNSADDPHFGIPVLDISPEEFETVYLAPFRALIPEYADAILVAHSIIPIIDPDTPFCLSKKGVTGILRKNLNYNGLVITDDISMQALARNGYSPVDAAVAALEAGCDMIMTSETNIRKLSDAIKNRAETNGDFMFRLDEAVTRILTAKQSLGLVKTSLQRYSESRIYNNTEKIFNAERYYESVRRGNEILERKNDS